jgi:single-strand DNA-binding protein
MKDVNKVILLGRLGADPVLRHTKTGTPVAHFSLATSRKFFREESDPSKGATQVEETQWHKVVAWGKRGETCAQYLKKGHPVYIEGFLKSHPYQDKEGHPRTSFEVYAEDVSFLGGRRADEPITAESQESGYVPVQEQTLEQALGQGAPQDIPVFQA